jgi:hypothetical protein
LTDDVAVVSAQCHHFDVAPRAIIIGGPIALIGAAVEILVGTVLPFSLKASGR